MSKPRTPRWMALTTKLDDDYITRLNLALTAFLIASFFVFIPAWLLDTRVLDSAAIWTKPQKFNVSLALHFATLAVLLQLVPREVRTGPIIVLFSYLAALSLVLEYGWVAFQAARGRRSHYNLDTQFEALMYAAMGIGAVLLIAIAMALAVQIWREGERSRPGLEWGAIIGLSLGFISTLIFASYMSSTGRYVGAPLDGGGATVPFFGWSREYGDLRPAHFVSLHLMQTVPLAGWIADRQGWNWKLIVPAVAILQTGLATLLFVQARAGQPFWPV